VDAYAFLSAIAQSGKDMSFPNVFVALDGQTVISAAKYFANGTTLTYSVNVQDSSVASCTVKGDKITFKGLKAGQTSAKVTAGNASFDFVITVREGAKGNGWL
jgi:hypothetical protein